MTVSTFCVRRTTEWYRYIKARGPLVDPLAPVKMGGGIYAPLQSQATLLPSAGKKYKPWLIRKSASRREIRDQT